MNACVKKKPLSQNTVGATPFSIQDPKNSSRRRRSVTQDPRGIKLGYAAELQRSGTYRSRSRHVFQAVVDRGQLQLGVLTQRSTRLILIQFCIERRDEAAQRRTVRKITAVLHLLYKRGMLRAFRSI